MNITSNIQRYIRWPVFLVALVLAAALSASVAAAASHSSTPTAHSAGPPAQPAGVKKWIDCLKKYGVTLPAGRRPGAGAQPPRAGAQLPRQTPAKQTPKQKRAFAACKRYQPKMPGPRR